MNDQTSERERIHPNPSEDYSGQIARPAGRTGKEGNQKLRHWAARPIAEPISGQFDILLTSLPHRTMQADQLDFLEEMISNAELLNCVTCQDETLHTHEEVLSIHGSVTELKMRCTNCMTCRTWLQIE